MPAAFGYSLGLQTDRRLVAAIGATLNPYLVWHDVHLNREVLDQLVAAAVILCTLVAADRRSVRWATAAGLLGGLGVLGNVRLLFIPLLLAAPLCQCPSYAYWGLGLDHGTGHFPTDLPLSSPWWTQRRWW